MTSAAILDPFLLSRFDARSSESSTQDPILVSHDGGAKEGSAVVSVRGDGIHVFDISELHQTSVYLLGPSSSTFSCPAISRLAEDNGTLKRKTYAAFTSTENRDAQHSISEWCEEVGDANSSTVQRRNKKLPHDAAQIFCPADSNDSVAVVSSKGDITILDSDLVVIRANPSMYPTSNILKICLLQSQGCTFLPADQQASKTVIATFVAVGDGLRLVVYTVGEDIENVCDEDLNTLSQDVVDASLSTTGIISIINKSGVLTVAQVRTLLQPRIQRMPSNSVQLNLKRFSDINGVSLIACHSSFVLLAAITSDTPVCVAILLLDLNYSVALATHLLSVPSSMGPVKNIAIKLTPASTSQALLVLSSTSTTSVRPAVFSVPLTVPPRSTVAAAMRSANVGREWIVFAKDTLEDRSQMDDFSMTSLKNIRAALTQNRVPDAESAYNAWVIGSGQNRQNGEYEFARRLVILNCQTGKPYSNKILQGLLEKGMVSNLMVDGGLLSVLLERKDWSLVQTAIRFVVDLPESDLIIALRRVVRAHIENESELFEPAEVNSGMPSLETLLGILVEYPVSPPSLRLALRRHVPEPESITAILKVLDDWLGTSLSPEQLLARESPQLMEGVTPIPPVEKIVVFLRNVIDASYILLLQYRPAKQLLQRLAAHLAPEIQLLDEVHGLFSSLEIFVKAETAAKEGSQKVVEEGDWKKRRKAAHERAAMSVGLYQIEEIYL